MKEAVYAEREGARVAQGRAGPSPGAADLLHDSPRMVAQRVRIEAAYGAVAQRQEKVFDDEDMPLQARASTPALEVPAAAPPNETGMPDQLKTGIEALSGMDMSGVRVHRNSDRPAQMQALAYAQGSDIHLAPGQEQYLAHEAWHVVQQRQGRVAPTLEVADTAVNDDPGLEQEADQMGERAGQLPVQRRGSVDPASASSGARVVQLGKDKKKRLKKAANKTAPRNATKRRAPDRHMEPETAITSGDADVTYHVMARENDGSGHYEEQYESPQLFWRGDDRGPTQVFETGFTSRNERDKVTKEGENRIIWRAGGATDDILPASAVCLAKDIRGSAFFPLTGEANFYLYAVCKSTVASTFKAQQDAEAVETGTSDFRRAERYAYDPAYEDTEEASAVWQFQEYAAHRVESSEVLGCFKVERRTLVPAGNDEDIAMAGIQFRLQFFKAANFSGRRDWKLQKKVLDEAKGIAAKYESFYPAEDVFLSYMGTVETRDRYNQPQTLEEAPRKVRRVQPVVVQGVFIHPDTQGAFADSGRARLAIDGMNRYIEGLPARASVWMEALQPAVKKTLIQHALNNGLEDFGVLVRALADWEIGMGGEPLPEPDDVSACLAFLKQLTYHGAPQQHGLAGAPAAVSSLVAPDQRGKMGNAMGSLRSDKPAAGLSATTLLREKDSVYTPTQGMVFAPFIASTRAMVLQHVQDMGDDGVLYSLERGGALLADHIVNMRRRVTGDSSVSVKIPKLAGTSSDDTDANFMDIVIDKTQLPRLQARLSEMANLSQAIEQAESRAWKAMMTVRYGALLQAHWNDMAVRKAESKEAAFLKEKRYIKDEHIARLIAAVDKHAQNHNTVALAETVVSGSSANTMLKAINKMATKAPELRFKLLLEQHTLGRRPAELAPMHAAGKNAEPLSLSMSEDLADDTIELGQVKGRTVDSGDVALFLRQAPYILGEDVHYQLVYEGDTAHKAVIVFNGSASNILALSIQPLGSNTARDVLLDLVAGVYDEVLRAHDINL